jgi:formate/nitrite transporter FocA (FNT family)
VAAVMTYLVAPGGLTHAVAGSVEASLPEFGGEWTVGHLVGGFMLPGLIGNIDGGLPDNSS